MQEGTFSKLGVADSLVMALKTQEIHTPTEIQQRTISLALENKDIIGQSETGTGKTLAYLLPIFQKIDVLNKQMQAIILAPTHELAIQILRQTELLAKDSGLPVTSTAIIGGVNIARQIDKLKEKPHILVGSAGRILELIQKKKIISQTVKTIVIDEADRLLDEHNLESVKAVIKSTQRDRQLMLFSATIDQATLDIANNIMKEPEVIKIQPQATIVDTIEHCYFVAEQRDKIESLRKLVRILNPGRALVFINKSDEIEITSDKLKYHGLKAEGIHGSSVKSDRKKVMDDFRSGKIQLLIASDIAARGLDIKGITHIFNLDIPEDAQNYLHRVGRTGRAGQSGMAISIVTVREIQLLKSYERIFKINIVPKELQTNRIVDHAVGKVTRDKK